MKKLIGLSVAMVLLALGCVYLSGVFNMQHDYWMNPVLVAMAGGILIFNGCLNRGAEETSVGSITVMICSCVLFYRTISGLLGDEIRAILASVFGLTALFCAVVVLASGLVIANKIGSNGFRRDRVREKLGAFRYRRSKVFAALSVLGIVIFKIIQHSV